MASASFAGLIDGTFISNLSTRRRAFLTWTVARQCGHEKCPLRVLVINVSQNGEDRNWINGSLSGLAMRFDNLAAFWESMDEGFWSRCRAVGRCQYGCRGRTCACRAADGGAGR